MRAIQKGKEPRELIEYRCKADAVYDGPMFTSVKEAIKRQLLKEQGYLCAYCMGRIGAGFGQMKVEHWHCQDNHPSEQLDYQNLLGVCLGNEKKPQGNQTCDTRKGNSDLKFNPANPKDRIERQIHFVGDGKIRADDAEFDHQLNQVLNLNYPRLRDNRKAVLTAVLNVLSGKPDSRTVMEIEKLLAKWNAPDEQGHLPAYCEVAVYYLRKKLKVHRI